MRNLLFSDEPLLVDERGFHRMLTRMAVDESKLPSIAEVRDVERTAIGARVGDVAIIPLHGSIEHRLSPWGYWFGGSSTIRFGEAFQSLVDDSTVSKIIVDVDSPGGTYPGIPELNRQIVAARGAKGPNGITAIANTWAASGAYWLATAFDRLIVMPSGQVGSIGSLTVHAEESRLLDEMGVTVTIFRNPPAKAEVNSLEPLTDEARDEVQRRINEITSEFQTAVARNRSVSVSQVRSDFGQGRMLNAKEAVAAGAADGVMSMDALMREFGATASRKTRGRHRVEESKQTISADSRWRRLRSRADSNAR